MFDGFWQSGGQPGVIEREIHIVLWDLLVIRVRAARWFALGRA